MISALIVYGTIAAVVSYSLLYWLKPGWRRSVEQPKHIFQRQNRICKSQPIAELHFSVAEVCFPDAGFVFQQQNRTFQQEKLVFHAADS